MAIQLTIVTPEGQAYDGPVEQVVLPGSEGDFGVLEQHERFLTELRPGAAEILGGSGASEWAAVSGGFADVGSEQVTVLVSRCDLAADLDASAVAAEINELETQLNQLSGSDEDAPARAELEFQLEGAWVRREVVSK